MNVSVIIANYNTLELTKNNRENSGYKIRSI